METIDEKHSSDVETLWLIINHSEQRSKFQPPANCDSNSWPFHDCQGPAHKRQTDKESFPLPRQKIAERQTKK